MPNLGTTEIILIVLLIMVLFGAKRLPDASRSLGRSLRIFKAETKGLREDDKAPASSDAAPATTPIAPPAPIAPPTAITPPAPVAVPAPLDAPGLEPLPQRQP